jgi:hypothetical protein
MITSTVVNYLRPDGIRLTGVFPWITLPGRIPPSYGGGFIDQANRTGSIVAFMPLLVGLSAWGVVTTYRPSAPTRTSLLRLPLLGVLAIPGGIMFYAYIAHRYTSEFVPVLLFGATIGLVDVVRRLVDRPRRRRLVVLGAVGVLAAWSVAATWAVAMNTRAIANPGPVLSDYVALQERISRATGDPIEGNVTLVDGVLADHGAADELAVIGDCQALYFGTGDEFRPWEEVGTRSLEVRVRVLDDAVAPEVGLPLATFDGHRRTALVLERSAETGFVLALRGGDAGVIRSDPVPVDVGDGFVVRVATDGPDDVTIRGLGRADLRVPKQTYDSDWRWRPNVFRPQELDPERVARLGVEVEVERGDAVRPCERLRSLRNG